MKGAGKSKRKDNGKGKGKDSKGKANGKLKDADASKGWSRTTRHTMQGRKKGQRKGQGWQGEKLLRQKEWRTMIKVDKRQKAELRWMADLTAGLDAGDLLTILEWPEHADTINTYDPHTHTLHSAAAIPWPIRWLLLRRHRKHISVSRALPSMEGFKAQLQDFGDRLKWKWYF